MVIIREAKKSRYEDSAQAYYEVEAGDPNVTVKVRDGKRKFEWHRQKSNANVLEKGFSFYYARRVFNDKYFLADSDIASDPKNTAIFGVVKDDKDVMVVIHTDSAALDKGVIRIVSAYYTTNQKLIQKYRRLKKLREFYETLESPEDDAENAWFEGHIRRIKEERRRQGLYTGGPYYGKDHWYE